MGISISITGMSTFLKDIPDGNLILVEGSIDPITSLFVQTIAINAFQENKPVHFISSRAEEEVRTQINTFQTKEIPIPIIEERSHRYWQNYITDNGLTIIDSFSYLNIERPLIEVRRLLEEFLKLCKQKEAIVIITTERGMLTEQVNVTCAHLADGIFRFLTKDTDQGLKRLIRIPKWMNWQSFDENIYYNVNGKEIKVDLRTRVR